jgi:hypothetical protein
MPQEVKNIQMIYMQGVGREGFESSIFGYGAISGQCITNENLDLVHLEKFFELILLRNGKFYSLDKIQG